MGNVPQIPRCPSGFTNRSNQGHVSFRISFTLSLVALVYNKSLKSGQKYILEWQIFIVARMAHVDAKWLSFYEVCEASPVKMICTRNVWTLVRSKLPDIAFIYRLKHPSRLEAFMHSMAKRSMKIWTRMRLHMGMHQIERTSMNTEHRVPKLLNDIQVLVLETLMLGGTGSLNCPLFFVAFGALANVVFSPSCEQNLIQQLTRTQASDRVGWGPETSQPLGDTFIALFSCGSDCRISRKRQSVNVS